MLNEHIKKEHIKIEGHKGTWYEIDNASYYGKTLYLMESEVYGDEAPCIIINNDNEIMAQEIYDGFLELDDRISFIKEDYIPETVDSILVKLIKDSCSH